MVVMLFTCFTTTSQMGLPDIVTCWQDRTPTSPVFAPTTFKQCLDTIKHKILVDGKLAMVPQHFSRTPGRGFTVPYTWRSGSCEIAIDAHSPEDEDIFRLKDLAIQATLVNIGCVAPAPHYGGTVQVGPREVMNVTILGWPFPRVTRLELDGDPERIAIAGH